MMESFIVGWVFPNDHCYNVFECPKLGYVENYNSVGSAQNLFYQPWYLPLVQFFQYDVSNASQAEA